MSELSITDRGPVRIVLIDGEARMNVLSRALVAELAAESKRAGGDSAIRAMVITGSGTRAFCAGANLKERRGWTDDDIRRWLVELHTALREIERCPKPWIAAVNGLALGGGCELALACDIVLAAEHASFGLPEASVGLVPGFGILRAPSVVGRQATKLMVLAGERLGAQRACELGLVQQVLPAAELLPAALKLGERIAERAPLAVEVGKRMVNRGVDRGETGYGVEAVAMLYATRDAAEGIAAFTERREPRFEGR